MAAAMVATVDMVDMVVMEEDTAAMVVTEEDTAAMVVTDMGDTVDTVDMAIK